MNSKPGTILLVDDDPAILLAVGDKLQFENYEVVKAASAEEALKELRTLTPDLIILDISMPGIGGLAFLKQISQIAGEMKYPVLVFTARAELDQFFASTGVDGFLSKTTDPETLMKEIDHIIRKRGATHTAKEEVSRTTGQHRRIMVAEDDPHKRERIVNVFTRYGYTAHGVASGYAVIENAIMHNPDVLLVKYIMPHINGPTIATMMGSMPSTRHIPVVLYDGTRMHDAASQFTNVRSFVPTDSEEALVQAVETILAS